MLNELKKFYLFSKKISLNSLSGSLAFFFLLTIFPIFFIVSLIIQNFNLITHLNINFNYNINTAGITGITILMIVSTIISIRKIISELRNCGEIVYGIKKDTLKGVRGYIKTILYVFLLVFIIAGLIIFYSLINLINIEFLDKFKVLFNPILILIIILTLNYSINYLACPKKIPFKHLIKGVIISTFLLYGVTFLYTSVLTHTTYTTIYGALAVFLIGLSYLYLLVKVIILGMIINAYLIRNKSFENK